MKSIKNVLIVLIFILTISCFFTCNYSNAELVSGSGTSTSKPSDTLDDIMTGANQFVSDGEGKVEDIMKDENDPDSLKNVSNFIYNVLLGIGIVFAVAIGSVLGVKFMISSVEEQAKIKELLVPYVAGCIVVFGAFGIWKIAVEVFKVF